MPNDVILRVRTDSLDACKKDFYDIKSLLIKGCRFWKHPYMKQNKNNSRLKVGSAKTKF